MDDGVLLSKRDAGRVQGMLRWFERSGRQAPRFRRRKNPDDGIIIRIFEVQSEAEGDGVYNCYQQTLDATDWEDTSGADRFDDKNDTSIEVLNLFESHPEAGISELVTGDRIAGWQWTDDEGKNKWVGIPVERDTNPIRKAYPKDDAPADTTITCYLDVDTIGEEIPVVCSVAGGEDLNTALPRLFDGDLIFVTNIDNAWYCITVFQSSKDCICSE